MTKHFEGDLDLRRLLLRAARGQADPGEQRALRVILRTQNLGLLAYATLGDDPEEYAPERAPETFLAEIEVEPSGRRVAKGQLADGTVVALTLEEQGDDALVTFECDQELDLLCLWRAPRTVAPLDAPQTFTFRLAGLVDLPEGNTPGEAPHGWALAAEDEAKKRVDKSLDAQWEQLGDAGCVLRTIDGIPRRLDFELAIRKARSGVVVAETSFLNREKAPAVDRSTEELIPAERSLVPLAPFPEDVVLSRHMARLVTSITGPGGASDPLMRGTFERVVPEDSRDFGYVQATIYNPTPQESLLSADKIALRLCDRTDDRRQFAVRRKDFLGYGQNPIEDDLVMFVTVDARDRRKREAVDRAGKLNLVQKMDQETKENFLRRIEARINSGQDRDLLRKDMGAAGDRKIRAEAGFARAEVKRKGRASDTKKLEKRGWSRIEVEHAPTGPQEDPANQAIYLELRAMVLEAIHEVTDDEGRIEGCRLVLLEERVAKKVAEKRGLSYYSLRRAIGQVKRILRRRLEGED